MRLAVVMGCTGAPMTVGDACRELLPALQARLLTCEGSAFTVLGCQGAQCEAPVDPAAVEACLAEVQGLTCEALASRPPIPCFFQFRCSAD